MARRAGTSVHAFGADPIVVAYGMGVDSTAMLGWRRRTRTSQRRRWRWSAWRMSEA
jgi:hypothetical protein